MVVTARFMISFLFLDARVLIHIDDFVCDIGGFLRISVEDADLKQIGVAHFIDFELAAQPLVSLLRGSDFARPFPIFPAVLTASITG